MARRKHDAPLLDGANAGTRTSEGIAGTAAHLNKHQRAVTIAHHQINLAPTAPGRPIIALQQLQARSLQKGQRLVFGRIAPLPRGAATCGVRRRRAGMGWLFSKEIH